MVIYSRLRRSCNRKRTHKACLDILDEDEYESEYDENQRKARSICQLQSKTTHCIRFVVDETEISNEDLDKLEDGLAYVYSVIGEDTILTASEIKEALWYYYFDREETINWALGKVSRGQRKDGND